MKLSDNISAFHHYAIKAQDFQVTLNFYRELGFALIHDWSLPEYNLERGGMLYNSKINSYIEIFDKNAEIPTQGRKRNKEEEFIENSILHICFVVKDAEKARISAINAGAKDLSEGVLTIDLSNKSKNLNVRNSIVYSPNGEVIEFLERVVF
ncbi:VOC family protein [Tenacibaculum sp. Bg11-29]|uniref:VOC family protein n=1 Tax=Tenacibaculum sp. Bg11-29 TaxID=2058306 RepID=UPI000C324D44|nr:VOC family protein [Tenacibaculum sp. Bg11-29]PKH50585.1 VOC family protein [Tenacibaculum sp. Bg11-29]